jgi:hypothetical protein
VYRKILAGGEYSGRWLGIRIRISDAVRPLALATVLATLTVWFHLLVWLVSVEVASASWC